MITGSEEYIREELTCKILKVYKGLFKNKNAQNYIHFLEKDLDFYFIDDYFETNYRWGVYTNENKICQYHEGSVKALSIDELDELLYRLEQIVKKL